MTKNKYTKKEMADFVKAIMAMYKVCAICIDRDEVESVVNFEKTGAGSFAMNLLHGFFGEESNYDVNADTLLEYDVRKNCVYLKLKEEYGDAVSFWLQFMQPMKPTGFPVQPDSKKEKRKFKCPYCGGVRLRFRELVPVYSDVCDIVDESGKIAVNIPPGSVELRYSASVEEEEVFECADCGHEWADTNDISADGGFVDENGNVTKL